MRSILLPLFALLTAAVAYSGPARCGCGENCDCGENCRCEKIADKPAAAETGHALKGVVVNVLAERGQVIVKHEEIPGVMRAMTMGFNVDEATLKAAAKGAAVSGTMVRRDGKYWLIDATFTPAE